MPRKPPSPRILRLVQPTAGPEPGVFSITTKKGAMFYVFQEILCAIGGRGFAIHRLGLGDLYHVRIGRPEDCSCECLGFLRHGGCKHIEAMLALVEHRHI